MIWKGNIRLISIDKKHNPKSDSYNRSQKRCDIEDSVKREQVCKLSTELRILPISNFDVPRTKRFYRQSIPQLIASTVSNLHPYKDNYQYH